jgi:AraC-like DNA-binding protein
VTVIVRRPAPPLRQLVRQITYQAGEQPCTSVEKILPSPSASLWVNLNRDEFRCLEGGRILSIPGAMLAGPRSRPLVTEFEQGRAHVSVAFAAGAAASFFGPLTVTADELVPLELLWGRHGAVLREQLLAAGTPDAMLGVLEETLLRRVTGSGNADQAVATAARELSGGKRVADVADGLGMLPRTLRRRFSAQIGLTPKRFARVQRMQRVVRALDGHSQVNWCDVASEHGYADQPHLTDEFRALADVTPREYLRSRVDGPNHLTFP